MRYFGWVLLAVFVLIAPNLIRLGTSTVRIRNASASPIGALAYSACEKIHRIGTVGPNESVFRFLEGCGDDTLEVLIGDSRFCQVYVEDELYHVDATIRAADSVRCEYDHLLSSLFIEKALR